MKDLQEQLSVFNPTNKEEIATLAEIAAQDIAEYGDPLEALAYTQKVIEFFNSFKKKIMPHALDEIARYGKESPKIAGVKLEQAETGVKYDYSVCNDSELGEMLEEQESIKERIKAREKFLRSLVGQNVASTETGAELSPPIRKSTTTIKCTINKA